MCIMRTLMMDTLCPTILMVKIKQDEISGERSMNGRAHENIQGFGRKTKGKEAI